MARCDELESVQKSVAEDAHPRNASDKKLPSIASDEIRILIRATCPADIECVRRFFTELSVESSYRRFFTGLGRIPERFVRQFVEVDHKQRAALVAVAGEQVIALADYALVGGTPSTAEIGVVVADRWQRLGLGQYLLGQLLSLAYDQGVRQLRAHALAENARVARLLRRRWPTARPVREDTLLLWHLPIDPPPEPHRVGAVWAGAGSRRPAVTGSSRTAEVATAGQYSEGPAVVRGGPSGRAERTVRRPTGRTGRAAR
jgi:GNAT superfamily N-acetyltransferase